MLEQFDRDKLFVEVWAEPVQSVATLSVALLRGEDG